MTKKTQGLNYHERMMVKHKKALEKMKEDPSIIGIEGIVEEPKIEFLSTHLGETAEIDLVVLTKNTEYLIEYKCSECDHDYDVKKQLRKAKRCINGKFNKKHIKMIYVHGEFNADELRGKGFIPFNYTPAE